MTNCPLKMYAFLFFILCFIPLSYASHEKKISDSALTEQAKTTIQREYSSIKLATINRVVYVYGSVDSNTDMDAIIEKVASIEGVKDVDTRNLFVQGSHHPLTDAVITAKVKGLFIYTKKIARSG